MTKKIRPSKTELILNEMIKESDAQYKKLIEKLDSINAKLDEVLEKIDRTNKVHNKDTKQMEEVE